MTREEAIWILENRTVTGELKPRVGGYSDLYDVCLEALKEKTHSEKRTEKRTETHECDLISRQAAIAYAISGRVRTLPTSEVGENWIRTEASTPTVRSTGPERSSAILERGKTMNEGWRDELVTKGAVFDAQEAHMAICPLDGYEDGLAVLDILRNLPPVQPLTDIEKRIFLKAISHEEEVCRKVDKEWGDGDPECEITLVHACHEIERKVKDALWT